VRDALKLKATDAVWLLLMALQGAHLARWVSIAIGVVASSASIRLRSGPSPRATPTNHLQIIARGLVEDEGAQAPRAEGP
jgi:hypothetical protein